MEHDKDLSHNALVQSSSERAPLSKGSTISIERYSAVLNMLVNGSPLEAILEALILLIEEEKVDTKGSVLLLSEDKQHLLKGAAPSLPKVYNEIIHGLEIGQGVGSCGTAAFTGKGVIVENIATHPYWVPFKEIALSYDLHACWSEPIKDAKGNVLGTFAMYYSVAKKPTEDDLRLIQEAAKLASLAIERSRALQFQRLSANIFAHLPEALVITNAKWSILNANPAFYQIMQATAQSIEQFSPYKLFRTSDTQQLDSLLEAVALGKKWQGELIGFNVDGQQFDIELTMIAFSDTDEKELCFSWLFTDITQRKKTEKLVNYQAKFDNLTHLMNRQYLFDTLQQHIKDQASPFSVMLMDLDKFKEVNDTLGHQVGDQLLILVAQRLKRCINKIEGGAMLARLGGDEFALFLPNMIDKVSLAKLASELNQQVSQLYCLDQHINVFSSLSIGIARFPEDANSLEQMLKCSDQAMYASKSNGRDQFQFFSKEMQINAERTAFLHHQLNSAIELEEFELYYQPIVSLKTNKIRYAEALLRWRNNGKLIPPDEFIPAAESCGLIIQIGYWVRRQAMKMLYKIQENHPGIGISINVSSHELSSRLLQDNLTQSIQEIAEEIAGDDFPFHLMTLEITESLLITNHHELFGTLVNLQAMGITIAIDDFGTGYSSLSYLSQFPIDQIKIDKSFIQSIEEPKQKILVETITNLSHALNLQIVAEGVETEQQLDYMRQKEVSNIQGYFFYKPMPESEFFTQLAKESKHN